ncbi:hypothetical protein [Phenylobacterium sp.]|jgi:uncharacterized membrane protein|uniref:DUF4870 family protein n=1 Tax=Phenylobacterium sp. TaxID=1871053 RepID=UPI002F41DC81
MSDPASTSVGPVADDRTMPAVTYGLYLLGFATAGATTLIGLVIAYANRAAATPAMATHYTLLIRTFWLALGWAVIAGALVLIGLPLSFVLIGIPILKLGFLIWALIGVWFAVRCVLGAIHLARGEAYPRPRAWLI